jgi:hypothetical protein
MQSPRTMCARAFLFFMMCFCFDYDVFLITQNADFQKFKAESFSFVISKFNIRIAASVCLLQLILSYRFHSKVQNR